MTQKIAKNDRTLLILPELAVQIGKWEAVILQQIHYHTSHSTHIRNGFSTFWKTFKDWAIELPFISIGTIRRAIKSLHTQGLIAIERHSAGTWYQANWYRVRYENLCSPCADGCDQVDHMDECKVIASFQENSSTENFSTQTVAVVEEKIVEEIRPEKEEILQAEAEIRKLRINPAAVRRELLKNFANFKGAVQKFKEIGATKEIKNPTGLLISLLRVNQSSAAPPKFEIPLEPEAIAVYCASHPEVKDYFFSSVDQAYKLVFSNGAQKFWSEVCHANIL